MAHLQHAFYRCDGMEIFTVENVSYTYRDGKKALDSVSLHIRQGESLAVIGANGSGKSTLLYLLDGVLKPQYGSITAFGVPLSDEDTAFRQKVSLLFQNPQVQLFSLSVWDELCFGPSQLGLPLEEIDRRASDILDLLGIRHLRERGPWNLSGGEMKKVAMGTCLSINPEVILLDEPTTGLDPRSQVEFIDLIVRLREAGKTIITATHDLGIIQDISDRTVVFGEDHRVMLEDSPWETLKNTDVLLRANLLHKHPHRHSWYVHEHSHSGLHDHEHIPELAASGVAEETLEGRPSEAPGAAADMEKLRILIEHWVEHNHGHAETYVQWAEKAGNAGIAGLAEMLKEIAEATLKIDALFAKAKKKLGDRSA